MNRPVTSQKVIDVFSKLVDSQDRKGLSKYGKTIDDAQYDEDGKPYDWSLMALEEAVDGLKYMMKENQFLRARMKEYTKKSWFPVYKENLKLVEENERFKKDVVDLKEENERLKKTVKAWEIAVNDMSNRLKKGKYDEY